MRGASLDLIRASDRHFNKQQPTNQPYKYAIVFGRESLIRVRDRQPKHQQAATDQPYKYPIVFLLPPTVCILRRMLLTRPILLCGR